MQSYFQVDDNNVFLFATQPYETRPHLCVAVAPPEIPTGQCAVWKTSLNPLTDLNWGASGAGTWALEVDNRNVALYQTADGSAYTIGETVEAGTFNGVGVIPVWLTETARPSSLYTWKNGAWYASPAVLLANAQTAQVAVKAAAYSVAVTQDVSYKSVGGVTKTYQADTGSQMILLQSFVGYTAIGTVPDAFWWKSSDNTHVPFTLADLKGLYASMLAQGQVAFNALDASKTAIMAATTVAAVQAVA